ncbi:gfo/Idh/MocA family oxidoreductase [Candidatus Parcubacteria bacterium]|nr:MAG: gfo/Idh/MocA family oxidoreductase [Candidatus Parcubacteria bacterium]
MKLRIGILGCANIAAKYAIPAFQEVEIAELVAIASRDEDKAKTWGAQYGLEVENYESLIAREDIDVIYSPLPIGLQEEWGTRVLSVGKHLICEKSITYSLDSAKRMVDCAKRNGVALYENFVPEFHPQHVRIQELITDGAIGKPHIFQGWYGFPPFPAEDIRYRVDLKGGALNDAGCYTVFMARKMLAQEPIAVTCRLAANGHEVDVEGSALLEFPNATAQLSFGFNNLYQNTYSIWGEKGLIRTGRAYALPPTLKPPVELITNDGSASKTDVVDVPSANQFALSFDYFCCAVLNDDTRAKDTMAQRILQQARVLEAMRISARDHRRVELL